MLCEYRFELKHPLLLPQAIPVWVSNLRFDFERKQELLVAVKVAVHCNDSAMWPRIEAGSRDGVKADIYFPDPSYEDVFQVLLTFLALLSLRGWDAHWNEQPPGRSWIAESDEESSAVKINNYQISIGKLKAPHDFPIRLNDLVQTALASGLARPLRQPLEFLQYATERHNARRFIEAFQYFYFVIESLYGNGRSNQNQILEAFMQSPRLRVKMRMALKHPTLYVREASDRTKYCAFVSALTPRDAFMKLIKTRGQLHHHTLRSPLAWSLNSQGQFFEISALSANVAMPLLFWECKKYLWGEDVLNQFEQIQASLSQGIPSA